jgi:hypothetical protein
MAHVESGFETCREICFFKALSLVVGHDNRLEVCMNKIKDKRFIYLLMASIFVVGCATQQKSTSLVGEIKENYYIHPTGIFRVKIDNQANISDSQANVLFTAYLFGTIPSWEEITYVNPEVTIDKSANEIIEIYINEIATNSYKGKEIAPSFLLKDERDAFGVRTTYAKVLFPELPGTGVFTDKGQKNADYIGHFHIVPIESYQLQRRNFPIRYLSVSSLYAKPFLSDDEGLESHESFLKRIEFVGK